MILELYPDCSRCEAICCVALAFDASAEFAVDKAAGEPCRHLTATNRCRIHSRLPEHGFSGCAKYDCYGAGQRATALIGQARFRDPSVRTRTLVDTFTRLVAAPFVGYFILQDNHAWAVGLFAYAGITDALDGWIARRWNSKTVVGTVIDPMADKALMTILTVCLAVKGALPGMYSLSFFYLWCQGKGEQRLTCTC